MCEERKAGWYWVGTDDNPWEVAHWDGGEWWVANSQAPWSDCYIKKIGTRIPTPDEPWQCVPVETTGEMDAAGCEAGSSAYADAEGIRIVDAWEAMLAAAPKP
jgi:hypothetical protein